MEKNSPTYKVHLPVFEGPLDLLLHLIKINEIDIYDIPIAVVTEQYLEYLELMEKLNLDIASEYLVMAATLAHIKSKMLLPSISSDEEASEEDPRSELVQRLLDYQRYKKAAEELEEKDILGRDVFPRPGSEEDGDGELRRGGVVDLGEKDPETGAYLRNVVTSHNAASSGIQPANFIFDA